MKKTMLFHLALVLFGLTVPLKAFSQEHLTLYLFRHAETIGEGSDRELSERGQQRANDLLTIINEHEVNALYSTPLNRTIQTIQPFVEHYGLEIRHYDHRDLVSFADSLKTLSGVILVSGHSNTTPALVGHLIGQEIAPIEESKYDNLFIVKFVDEKYTLTHIKFPPFSSQK